MNSMIFRNDNPGLSPNPSLLATSSVLLCIALAGVANAQSASDQRLLECAAIQDADDRMKCFDAVVDELQPAAPEPEPMATEPAPEAAPEPVAEPVPAAAPVPAAEPVPAAAPEQSDIDSFGLVSSRNTGGVTEILSVIATSNRSGQFHFVVELENGQVWEETDGSQRIAGLPKVGAPVRIFTGRFGGYRMKVGNDNRIANVRRLR